MPGAACAGGGDHWRSDELVGPGMKQHEAIDVLAKGRPAGAISVVTMQAMWPWREAGQAERDHLDIIGCMGVASPVGLGLAMARPNRKVMVIDGDGSLLMQLGSLVTVAGVGPANYYHFVFQNGVHETSGNQELPALGKFDFCGLALAAGFRRASSFEIADTLRDALPDIWNTQGPVLIRLAIERKDRPNPWPKVPFAQQVQGLREALAVSR